MQRKRGDRGTGRYSVWTDLDLSVLQTCERKLFGICVFINQGFRTERRGGKKNVDVFLGKGFHHCYIIFLADKSLKYLALGCKENQQ